MQLSLFSISYAGLWGQARLGLHDLICRAGELGFESVMIAGKRPHLSILDADGEELAALRDVLATSRVSCAVVAGYTDFGAQVAAEVPLAEMQISYVESLARIAAALGAGIVRVFTSYERAGENWSTLWERSVTHLREACDRAARHGVTIAIQNHHDLAVHTSLLLELLLDIDRPNCKLGFDAWSPALRGEDLYEAARLAAPHTVLTTNADYVRFPRFRYRPELVNYEPLSPDAVRAVPFGTGFIDYQRFFQGLRDGGFDGVAAYEICSPIRGGGTLENLDHCAQAYSNWMQAQHLV